ncbi:hypothetical protein LCGC14_2712330, partial [marine sediment metagenome]
MFTISRKIEIDAGHRVPYHHSKCRYLHGHRWTIVAHVSSHLLVKADPDHSDSGMVVDFGYIKQVLTERIHDQFDHRMILWERDPLVQIETRPESWGFMESLKAARILESTRTVPCIPTAEGLAEHW